MVSNPAVDPISCPTTPSAPSPLNRVPSYLPNLAMLSPASIVSSHSPLKSPHHPPKIMHHYSFTDLSIIFGCYIDPFDAFPSFRRLQSAGTSLRRRPRQSINLSPFPSLSRPSPPARWPQYGEMALTASGSIAQSASCFGSSVAVVQFPQLISRAPHKLDLLRQPASFCPINASYRLPIDSCRLHQSLIPIPP